VGVLQRFERRLESMVTGAFSKAFRSEVQPVEIAAAIQREIDNNAQIVSRQRSLVPNAFIVELGDSDYDRLSPYEGTLASELVELAQEHAELQHYAFTGPVTITLERHDDLRTGQFRVRSAVRAGVDRGVAYSASGTAPASDTHGSLLVNGTQHPIVAPGLVIGRGSDCDIRIEDPGVSRRHAEVRVHGTGENAAVVVVDLGSTNGTVVDGAQISQAPVSDGSRIVIGNTTMVLRGRAARG